MILLDVNVLVYSHREDMAEHADFAAWLTGLAEGTEPFALCAGSVAGFVRVVTHPKIFVNPTSLDVALRFIDGLTESPACRWVEPGDRWWSIFVRLCHDSRARANHVPDAQLAATALEHGYRVATGDRGFARYAGLRWFHPLADIEGRR